MLELTAEFLACDMCPEDFGNGDGLLADVLPRGWAGSAHGRQRPILIASLNPGHPIEGEVDFLGGLGLYPRSRRRSVGLEVARGVLDFCSAFYDADRRSRDHIYARKVIGYIRAASWLVRRARPDLAFEPRSESWRNLAWITDSFKCSTRSDSGPRIPRRLMRQCIELHLAREIDACRPLLVIALGDAAGEALADAGVAHVRIRHAAQGAPPLPSERLDDAFEAMASALGLPGQIASSPEFRAFRAEVHAALFFTPSGPKAASASMERGAHRQSSPRNRKGEGMSGSAVMVFTQETVEQLLQQGGSSCWALAPDRAARCDFVVCARNSRAQDHGTAILIGRLTILGDCARPGRARAEGYTLFFDRYALLHVEDAWPGHQYPVSYAADVEELLGLDLTALDWHDVE